MTATPIMPFKAEFIANTGPGAIRFRPCEVVAVSNEFTGHGQFTILVEDEDGMLWTQTVDSVRRLAA